MDSNPKSYAKWITDKSGRARKRYVATEPANMAVQCTCGFSDCHRSRLMPFRDHIAELYQVIRKIHQDEITWSDSSEWSSVLYGLRMAASIEDVEADTGYVEEAMVFALCEPSIDYEDGQSEMASKYVAAAAAFNFLWAAYEASVALASPNEFRRLAKEGRMGERGRRLLEARLALSQRFQGIDDLTGLALWHCRAGGLMRDRCDRIDQRYKNAGLITAAELAREFRNFLFHGEDEAPHHENWGDEVISRCRLYRFYSVGRLVLLLIQAMCWIAGENDVERHEYGSDDDQLTVCELMERLQFKGPGLWPPLAVQLS